MKAKWNGVVLAESNNTIVIEGNHYFPKEALRDQYFHPSEKKTQCPWKGEASYFDIEVGGQVNEDAAWFYKEPFEAAKQIKEYIAFWKDVEIS